MTKIIGLVAPMSSGKSAVINVLKDRGYPTLEWADWWSRVPNSQSILKKLTELRNARKWRQHNALYYPALSKALDLWVKELADPAAERQFDFAFIHLHHPSDAKHLKVDSMIGWFIPLHMQVESLLSRAMEKPEGVSEGEWSPNQNEVRLGIDNWLVFWGVADSAQRGFDYSLSKSESKGSRLFFNGVVEDQRLMPADLASIILGLSMDKFGRQEGTWPEIQIEELETSEGLKTFETFNLARDFDKSLFDSL